MQSAPDLNSNPNIPMYYNPLLAACRRHPPSKCDALQAPPVAHLSIGIPKADRRHVPLFRQQRGILCHGIERGGGRQHRPLGIVVRERVVRSPRPVPLGLLPRRQFRFRGGGSTSVEHIAQRVEGDLVIRAGG